VFPVAVTPAPLAPILKEEFPEIIDAARLTLRSNLVSYENVSFYERGIAIADPAFLKMFTYPVVQGNPDELLNDPYSAVITEQTAEKYFGSENPIGKSLRIDNRHDFTVKGVIKDVPHNSHLQFNILVPVSIFKEMGQSLDIWTNNWIYTYVLLDRDAGIGEVSDKIAGVIKQHNESSVTDLYLQPLTRIHLHSDFTADIGGHGNVQSVYIFSVIALVVLLIACINFMNLSTARSANRAREVGMRKIVGAVRTQLIGQFFGESVLIAFIALVFSIVFIVLLLPAFNALSGKELSMDVVKNWPVLLGLIAITLFTGLFSGSYPALLLSSFQPVKVLRGRFKSGAKSSMFRRILVVVQFSLSIILIIGTAVIYNQLEYIRNIKLGFDKEHLIYITMRSDSERKYAAFKEELSKYPGIMGVTSTSSLPTYMGSSSSGFNWEGKNPDDTILLHYNWVAMDFVETMKMEMASGRSFSREFPSDTVNAVIVNEEAVRVMGLESPLTANFSTGDQELNIIGVVKDFHFKPVHTKIEPIVMGLEEHGNYYVIIRVNPDDVSATLGLIEDTWNKIMPGYPFEFSFLDEEYDRMYRAEENLGTLVNYFSVFAILIACLGLFGLASFTAEQRTKEIGIRKVLGASISSISLSLCREFVVLVLLANVIAWPAAYFALEGWLNNFAYRSGIGWAVFVLAALLALTIAIVTVSYQAIRAARLNPVDALKYE